MTKTLIKKIPLFLLITNSFHGPFKTKTKENLLPSSIFPSLWHRRCSNNKSNQVSLFYSYSDFNFFPVIFRTTIMTFIPNNCIFFFLFFRPFFVFPFSVFCFFSPAREMFIVYTTRTTPHSSILYVYNTSIQFSYGLY